MLPSQNRKMVSTCRLRSILLASLAEGLWILSGFVISFVFRGGTADCYKRDPILITYRLDLYVYRAENRFLFRKINLKILRKFFSKRG